uniref:Uncharacterized protein n=1 Tax=Setaria digitata TaxID=48799 RepID=A0A915PSN7_9BILA
MKRRDIRKKIRRCLGKKNISLAKKICNRSLRYAVLPRAAPFLCTKCGFATIMLKRIEEHVCMKKNSSVNDLERDIKVAQMGVRSRCKDAMGVLERLPNPQSIRLPKFRILENEPVIGMCGITSLNLSSHDSSKAEIPVACCSSDENSSSRQIVEKSFYCIESEVAFPNYEDFKRDHCTPSPGISSAKARYNLNKNNCS